LQQQKETAAFSNKVQYETALVTLFHKCIKEHYKLSPAFLLHFPHSSVIFTSKQPIAHIEINFIFKIPFPSFSSFFADTQFMPKCHFGACIIQTK